MYPEVKEVQELTKDKIQKTTMFLHCSLPDPVPYDFHVLLHVWELHKVGKLHLMKFVKERRVKKRRFGDGIWKVRRDVESKMTDVKRVSRFDR
jgi:hypothetical protein